MTRCDHPCRCGGRLGRARAGVGFIAPFGVAVLNGFVLVSDIKQRQDEGALPTVYVWLFGPRRTTAKS